MKGSAFKALLGAAALLALGAACRQLVGIGDEPPMDVVDAGKAAEATIDGGPTCGIAYAPARCESCLESRCCEAAKACAGGTACAGLEGCLGRCAGDPACRARCVDEHRIQPDPLELSLGSCLAQSCAGACGIVCGAMAQYYGADAAASCQDCFVNGGCSAAVACGSDPTCLGEVWCAASNPLLDRLEACQAGYDAGADAFHLAGNAQACSSACSLGDQWFCVGSAADHPPNPPGPTTVHLVLVDAIDKTKPVPDAAVTVCDPLDPNCQAPPSGTSDADGAVTLQVPTVTAAGLGASGYVFVSGPGLLPELGYWGFPLSEPSISGSLPVASTNERDALVTDLQWLGVSVDLTSHAIMALGYSDCLHASAEGLQISVTPTDPDAGTRVFYFSGTTISATADSTDSTGAAIIVNVPTPRVTVTATPKSLGKPASVVQMFTRPGIATVLETWPNQ